MAAYQFGPYRLDAAARRLTRDAEPVALSDRHFAVLHALVSRAGAVVSKEQLIEAAWGEVAVTDNSLEQAVSALRRTLGPAAQGSTYIETLARRGYRFGVAVAPVAARASPEALDALLAPYRAFLDGRAAIETLHRREVARAVAIFADVLRVAPDYGPAHLGLANAFALQFEATRAEARPDVEALARAVSHADEACRLDPQSGEAWAALGLACHQSRDTVRAVAAARRAVSIDPDNWRHYLRLAFVSWGEERLGASRRVLRLLPGFPFAHWLAATVHVARQALDRAQSELEAGAAAQDQHGSATRFGAVGLHLLLGLVRLAAGDRDAASRELERELTAGEDGHIYAREARANTCCALGAIHLRAGDREAALAAFGQALSFLPAHSLATAARTALLGEPLPARPGGSFDAAYAQAVVEALSGRPGRAAALLHTAIDSAPPGSAGWGTPIDPLLDVQAHPGAWARTLGLLRARAA